MYNFQKICDHSISNLNMNTYKSNYQQVSEFTNAVRIAQGKEMCPTTPSPMNRDEVLFLVGMVISELSELVDTVSSSSEETKALIESCLHVDPSEHKEYKTDIETIAAQADAMGDAWYYMCDAACKKGMNISNAFDIIHKANMNKLVDGKVLLREDGKVLKPKGWVPPDQQIIEYFSELNGVKRSERE